MLDGASVTVCDCVGGGTFTKDVNVGKRVLFQESNAGPACTLTINGGSFRDTVEANPAGTIIVENGSLNDILLTGGKGIVNGGIIKNNNGSAVIVEQRYTKANNVGGEWFGSLEINGGTIDGSTSAIKNIKGGSITINDGVIKGVECGIDNSWRRITINDGEISATSGPGIRSGGTRIDGTIVIIGGKISGGLDSYGIEFGSIVLQVEGSPDISGGAGDILFKKVYNKDFGYPMPYLELTNALGDSVMLEIDADPYTYFTNGEISSVGDTTAVVRLKEGSTASAADLDKFSSSSEDSIMTVDTQKNTIGFLFPKFITDQPTTENPSVGADDIPGYTTSYKWLYSATETGAGDPVGDTSYDLAADKVTETGWYWCKVTWSNGVDTPLVRETEKVYFHVHNLCNDICEADCTEHTDKLTYKVVSNFAELKTALETGGSYVLTSGSYSSDTVEDIKVKENVNLCLGDVSSLDLGKARLVVAAGKTLNITTCAPMSGDVKFINTTTCDAPVEIEGNLGLYGVGLVINAKSDYGVENYGTLHVDCGGIEASTAKTAIYHSGDALLFAGGSDVIAPTTDVYLAEGKFVTLKGGADALAASLVIDTAAAPSYGSGRAKVAESDTVLDESALAKVQSTGDCFSELSADNKQILFGVHGGWINGFCRHGELQPCETDADGNYVITNAGQLYWFAERVNEHGELRAKAVLANDIEIPEKVEFDGGITVDVPGWAPIGTESKPYNGDFDGGEHSIKGISFDNANATYAGLFGAIDWSGTVKDLTVTDSSFRGAYYVGAIAGYSEGEIINCHNENTTVRAEGSFDYTFSFWGTTIPFGNSSFAGGICGSNQDTIKNSTNSGAVFGEDNLVGGISGFGGVQEGCTNKGNVTGGALVGGIVGGALSGTTDSANLGTITANGDDTVLGMGVKLHLAGGISGWNMLGNVERCYNEGDIIGSAGAGGICGAFGFTSDSYYLKNCYNTGDIKADQPQSQMEIAAAGGIAGAEAFDKQVKNCHSVGTSSGTYPIAPLVDSVPGFFDYNGTENSYYLAATEGTDGARTAAQFASGEVTLLLNSGNADPVWGQKIGLDPYPIFGTIQLPIADAVIELSDEEFVYDGTEKSVEVLSVTLRTRAAVPESAYTVSGGKGTDAGTYRVTVTANEDSDYYGTATAEFRILPKTITADIAVANKTYDGTDGARITSAELVGIVSGDDVALVLGSAKFSDALPGVGKSVTFSGFSLSGADAGNYELQPLSATADITPVPAAARPNPSTGVHF